MFNKAEDRILTWSSDGTARMWDANDGSPIGLPMRHRDAVGGAVFNQDETRILTRSYDGAARIWDVRDGSAIGQPMRHDRNIYGAMFNRTEDRILTWSSDGTARLWDIQADEDFPKEHLSLIVKVATGTVIDDYGNVTTLSKQKWEEHKAEYIRIAEEHLKHCKHKSANIYLNYQKPNWSKKMTGSDKKDVSQK
jgi:WD40 repeat protein